MERRSFLKKAAVGAAMGAAIAAPAVHAQQAVRWRLASSFPKALDTIFGAADEFARIVKEASGGRMEISVHAGGELMPPFGVVDGVQNGTVEMAHTAPYYYFGKDPTFALDCAIPFGLSSRQQTAWMYEGNGSTLMNEFYKQYNIVSFPGGNTGVQMGGWYRNPVNSLKDIQGLKMRIGGFGGKVLEAIGGVPQNIPGGEIYQALEKGTIDATEWVGPYDDLKLGFYKVAKNYLFPAWWEGGPQLTFYINQKAWDALPADLKAVVKAAASYAHVDMQAKYDGRNPRALKQLVANGVKLARMPKDIMDAAFKASQQIYSDLSASNPNWKKVYADWSKFRADEVEWFGLAEDLYSSFISQQKL